MNCVNRLTIESHDVIRSNQQEFEHVVSWLCINSVVRMVIHYLSEIFGIRYVELVF
jgi:hypothetical protein